MKNRNWYLAISMFFGWLGYFLAVCVANGPRPFYSSTVALIVTVGGVMFFKYIFTLVPRTLAAFTAYFFGFFALWATVTFVQ